MAKDKNVVKGNAKVGTQYKRIPGSVRVLGPARRNVASGNDQVDRMIGRVGGGIKEPKKSKKRA